jgi:hypothetical protein
MGIYIEESERRRHPYYTIMDLKEIDLAIELKKWSRLDLIDWLSWNDSNGVYKDADSLREFGYTVSKDDATEIMIRQIAGGY